MRTKHAAYGLPYPTPSSDVVSRTMQGVGKVDTAPERNLRSALHRLGYRFRKDYSLAVGGRKLRVDIAFPTEGLVVFVDGCFWHQCPEHGTVPKSNRHYWRPKLKRNVERDARTNRELRRAGWNVLRLWEHVAPRDAAMLVAQAVEGCRTREKYRGDLDDRIAVDLFAGAGGSTVGLKQAGFQVAGAIECEPNAAETYKSNHKEVTLFEEDIKNVDPVTFRTSLALKRGELTLLNACPPCQGFSTLGTCNASDERNDLVSIIVPFLHALLPSAFIIENVPGLRNDQRMEELLREARDMGYAVKSYVVNAVDFGVPQSRRRLIAIGIYGGTVDAFPEHPVELLPRSFRRDPLPIMEVLKGAGKIDGTRDLVHRARQSSPAVLARIKSIPVNGDRFDLPVSQQLKCHKALGRKRSASASYGRMRLDQPAPTLTTRCTTPACGRFVHPTEDRGISLREAALIQTFPQRYRFSGSYQSVEAQIGNAVPARLASGLGLAVSELLFGVENG